MAILVFSPNGTYVTKPTLEAARTSADCVGKTVVVTSALTAAQSDITAAWPTDRKLKVETGGEINNTAAFTVTGSLLMSGGKFGAGSTGAITINGEFFADQYQVFSGTGTVTGLFEVSPHWWGAAEKTDITVALNKALASVASTILAQYAPTAYSNASAGVIKFKTGTYLIGAVNPITEAITFDFNRSKLIPNTTGIMFTIAQVSTSDPYYVLPYTGYPTPHIVGASDRVILKNAVVYGSGGLNPTNVIKVLFHGYYSLIDNFHIRLVTATGALIYHYSGEGMTVRDSTFSDSSAPAVISIITISGNAAVQSNAILLDHILIQDHTGAGVYVNGGDISITNKSVIQGCTTGGIVHGGEATANIISVSDSYFESNGGYGSIDAVGRYGTGGNHVAVKSSFFGGIVTGTYHIVVGAKTNITVQDCTFDTAGVGGAEPALNYVGINNKQQNITTGYTGGPMVELADGIRASNNIVIIKNGMSISRGGSLGSPTSGVAFTAFTTTEGIYLVNVYMASSGAAYVATATIFNDGTNAMILDYTNGANITITLSGLDCQFTQSSGTANTVQWSMVRVK